MRTTYRRLAPVSARLSVLMIVGFELKPVEVAWEKDRRVDALCTTVKAA